ncbi:MAG: phosphatidylserine decarboxylase family protein [Cyclobacteriaceae bacterium]|nr:phosphatidylserine decarboxylase family protein [Cyclobacteriaceae bacterium]MCB9238140.1 phosphatidylserine decarboxylase family protein [Flammeovirgaceae bacterium]MCB0499560.1 phosphatidylserine decarboxylase family protein [Cyclobacteriaceae bacterium]MCO5272999.1 phosphatidylserine decarboxylase family protein [Cyclobacteriaceae bacterium]MCW5901536.1 phosphatidylserine decarboxylase family protein [Cyclobacteriaceae bacterium]
MTIHKEGRKLLFILLVLLGLANIAASNYLPGNETARLLILAGSTVAFLLVLQFFRSPVFEVAQDERQVLAPADGKVVVIEETEETEYLKERRRQISIFMSPVNVHVNRMPVGGSITYYKYHPGKYLVAWHPKSSTENERTTVVAKMKNGTEVLFRQIAGAVARRIKCYVEEGQELEQGQEFGFIKFGSRVDVFLPLNAKINIKTGDTTRAGKTVLAEFQ